MKTEKQQAMEAADFAKRWEGRGYEKGDSQVFWTELLTEVYGVENPSSFIKFEQQAQLDHTSFIDVMIPSTKVMIEQKSLGKDLRTPIKQSDGTMLNPFQQAQRYMMALPVSQHPRWIVTCYIVYNNFPWPNPNEEQRQKIEHTAQAVLDARAKYADSSLADLYDPVLMPPELRKAHQDNDRAMMQAYGFSLKMTESDCVAALFQMYAEQTEKK
ncbi:MAG: type IIL restriction-modification enzyme MmeI [Prevotella sp.]